MDNRAYLFLSSGWWLYPPLLWAMSDIVTWPMILTIVCLESGVALCYAGLLAGERVFDRGVNLLRKRLAGSVT